MYDVVEKCLALTLARSDKSTNIHDAHREKNQYNHQRTLRNGFISGFLEE